MFIVVTCLFRCYKKEGFILSVDSSLLIMVVSSYEAASSSSRITSIFLNLLRYPNEACCFGIARRFKRGVVDL